MAGSHMPRVAELTEADPQLRYTYYRQRRWLGKNGPEAPKSTRPIYLRRVRPDLRHLAPRPPRAHTVGDEGPAGGRCCLRPPYERYDPLAGVLNKRTPPHHSLRQQQ